MAGRIRIMTKEKWRGHLEDCFEKIRLIEKCQAETKENFTQFCEFIAEPAFEALSESLKEYGIKGHIRKEDLLTIRLDISFAKTRATQFSYEIHLPKNSIQLKLKLRLLGRKDKKSPFREWREAFMPQVDPDRLLALTKEELIVDIINHYRDFMIEILTSAE